MNKELTTAIRNKFPLYLQILVGMVVGVMIGFIALKLNGELFINDWIRPWGRVFIRLLQLLAVPLVFFSLIKGVMGIMDVSKFAKIGVRTILIYISTTVVAVLLGLSLGLLVKPGKFFNPQDKTELISQYEAQVETSSALSLEKRAPLGMLDEIIPSNIFSAATDNGKVLQVIFFTVLLGIAIILLPNEKMQPVVQFFDAFYLIMLKVVDFIISTAPFGVAALMAGLVVDFAGQLSMFGALGIYALTTITGLLILMFGFYPLLILLFTKIGVRRFMKTIYPVQLFAFSTSSSAATLPLNLEVTEKRLGVSNQVTSFVLPVGSTVNMDGTSLFQTVAIIFIAQVLGIELTLSSLVTIVMMSVISSIGTPSVPGGSYVIMTMVLSSVGIPEQGLALILGIERPLDMLRTAVNVTGDATVAAIVDHSLATKLDIPAATDQTK